MSESTVLEVRATKHMRRAIMEVATQLYMTGQADSDTMSEFVRTAIREKIKRERDRIQQDKTPPR